MKVHSKIIHDSICYQWIAFKNPAGIAGKIKILLVMEPPPLHLSIDLAGTAGVIQLDYKN